MADTTKRNLAIALCIISCVLTVPLLRNALNFVMLLRIIPVGAIIWPVVACGGLLIGVALFRVVEYGFGRTLIPVMVVLHVVAGLVYDYKTARVKIDEREAPVPFAPNQTWIVSDYEDADQRMGFGEYLHQSITQTSFLQNSAPPSMWGAPESEAALGLKAYWIVCFQLAALCAGTWLLAWMVENLIGKNRKRARSRGSDIPHSHRRRRRR